MDCPCPDSLRVSAAWRTSWQVLACSTLCWIRLPMTTKTSPSPRVNVQATIHTPGTRIHTSMQNGTGITGRAGRVRGSARINHYHDQGNDPTRRTESAGDRIPFERTGMPAVGPVVQSDVIDNLPMPTRNFMEEAKQSEFTIPQDSRDVSTIPSGPLTKIGTTGTRRFSKLQVPRAYG